MKTKNIAGLTVTMALIFIICEFSLAGDDFLKSMESDFIKIVEDVGPAIVEVSAALKSSWTVIESPSKDVADLEKSIVDMEIQLEVLKKTLPIADPEIIKLQDQIAASREALKHGEHTVATWSLMDEHRPSVRENVGTGIIIDRSGYIVTTQSVVGGAKSVQVNLADGRDFEAKIVGADPDTDIALVKIDAENLPTAPLGNSDTLKAGSWVVTIGRSYGKSPTLSFGIVGGLEPLPGRPAYYDAIKINASASPGNSGGGVIDTNGTVVGIITAALAEPRAIDFEPFMPQSSIAELRADLEQAKSGERLAKAGLINAKTELDVKRSRYDHGLAILSDVLKAQADYMSTQSQYQKALTDLKLSLSQFQNSSMYNGELPEIEKLRAEIEETRKQFEQVQRDKDKSMKEMLEKSKQWEKEYKDQRESIMELMKISAQWEQEHKARLEDIRDTLRKLQTEEIPSRDRFLRGSFLDGREASFAIPINHARMVIDDLMKYGRVERGWLGIIIRELRRSDRERLGLDTLDGAIVAQVNDGSPAARAGIRNDDVIISFNSERIKTPADLMRILANTKPNAKVNLTIIRDKQEQSLSVKVGKRPGL
jgi:S1-C subfamily serine protease